MLVISQRNKENLPVGPVFSNWGNSINKGSIISCCRNSKSSTGIYIFRKLRYFQNSKVEIFSKNKSVDYLSVAYVHFFRLFTASTLFFSRVIGVGTFNATCTAICPPCYTVTFL